jgi:hypothetical protein
MGAPSITWDTAFEAAPAGSDLLSTVDTAIQTEKSATRERFEREHRGALTGTQSKHGWHRKGSAVCFYQKAAPTTKLDPAASSLDDDDLGRFWFDYDDLLPYVWAGRTWSGTDADYDGTGSWSGTGAWTGFLREIVRVSIQGSLAVGTNVVPRIVLPRACRILKVNAYCETAPTGASILIDINKNGNTGQSIFSGYTRITITAGSNANSIARTSSDVEFHATYSVLAADDQLTIDLDQVGSTVTGSDISLSIEVALG